MQLWDLIDPQEFTGYLRTYATEYEQNQAQSLAGWVPTETLNGLEYSMDSQPERDYEAAKYRGHNAGPLIIARKTALTRLRGGIPPISVESILSELDQIMLDGMEQDIRDAVFADGGYLAQSIVDRIEMQRGEAIDSSAVQLAENGLHLPAVEFDRDAGNSFTSSTLVTDAACDFIGLAKAWVKQYRAANGNRNPGVMLTSEAVVDNILLLTQMKQLAAPNPANATITGAGITIPQLAAILQAFNLPPIATYDRVVPTTDANGNNRADARVLPEHKLYLMPNEEVGKAFYGIVVTSADTAGLTGNQRGGIVGTAWKDPRTKKFSTMADATALCVLGRSQEIFDIEVQAAA